MSLFCPPHLRPVVTDATWREPGRQFSGWRPTSSLSQWEQDSLARLIDRPPPTTFTTAARLAFGRAARATLRHLRAAAAALASAARTYRESLRVHP